MNECQPAIPLYIHVVMGVGVALLLTSACIGLMAAYELWRDRRMR